MWYCQEALVFGWQTSYEYLLVFNPDIRMEVLLHFSKVKKKFFLISIKSYFVIVCHGHFIKGF